VKQRTQRSPLVALSEQRGEGQREGEQSVPLHGDLSNQSWDVSLGIPWSSPKSSGQALAIHPDGSSQQWLCASSRAICRACARCLLPNGIPVFLIIRGIRFQGCLVSLSDAICCLLSALVSGARSPASLPSVMGHTPHTARCTVTPALASVGFSQVPAAAPGSHLQPKTAARCSSDICPGQAFPPKHPKQMPPA
jgi:hypothetical protein